VKGSVLLGAASHDDRASDYLRSPFSLPDQTVGVGTYTTPFSPPRYPTPTLRSITHRFTYDSLSRCDSHVTDTVPDTIGVQFGCK
jgi:hypothetical protein